jgi:hypothetical protein
MASEPTAPLRLFLDAGVIIDGCFNRWGTCKGVLILSTLRASFHVVLAEPILAEVRREIERRINTLPADRANNITANVDGWLRRIRREVVPWPSTHEMRMYQTLMSAVRHEDDMASIVAAVLARPDWVLSTNTRHWNQDVATRTGLRIATPLDFLERLQPRSGDT